MDRDTILIIAAVVVLILLVVIVANARRRTAVRTTHDRVRLAELNEGTAEARLSRLADLRSKGLVTEEEYEAQRRTILGEL